MNNLSTNIRFLRKHRKLSQQQLADDLGVKRSNIAAYETKNVEPRLSLIGSMAKYFEVALEEFIVSDLSEEFQNRLADGAANATVARQQLSSEAVQQIRQVTEKVQRMLEGFKVFYQFKLDRPGGNAEGQGEIDNFLVFINHMSEYNQRIEELLSSGQPRAGSGGVHPGFAEKMVEII